MNVENKVRARTKSLGWRETTFLLAGWLGRNRSIVQYTTVIIQYINVIIGEHSTLGTLKKLGDGNILILEK